MLVSSAIARIKSAGHDISDEYTTEACLAFLNTAIQRVYGLMVGFGYPPIVKEMDLHEDDSLPHNYMQSCGTYPIRITNNLVHLLDDDIEYVRFRYFANPNVLTIADLENEDADEEHKSRMPFDHDAINEVILKGAIQYALNENEYDISQDSSLLQDLQQAIATGMGAGT